MLVAINNKKCGKVVEELSKLEYNPTLVAQPSAKGIAIPTAATEALIFRLARNREKSTL